MEAKELLRIAGRLGCKYQDRCSGHTRGNSCPKCQEVYKQRYCAHETMCPACEAADALRQIAATQVF